MSDQTPYVWVQPRRPIRRGPFVDGGLRHKGFFVSKKRRFFAKSASGGSMKYRDAYMSKHIAGQEAKGLKKERQPKVDSGFLQDCNALAAQWAARKK